MVFSEFTRFLRHVAYNKPHELNPITYFEVAQFLAATLHAVTCVLTIRKVTTHLQPIIDILQKQYNGLGYFYSPFPSKVRLVFDIICLIH